MNTIWIAVGALTLLGLVFGAILGYASRRFAGRENQSLRARRRSRHAENCRVAKRRAATMRW